MLTPIRKTSLASEVYLQLRDHILSGSIEPGDSLPAERQLGQSLGVNRSAVREALKRLEQAGLIEIHHGGGTKVLDPRRHGQLGLLPALIQHHPELTCDSDALRAVLMPELARAAARQTSSGSVRRLEMLADLMRTQEDAEDVDSTDLVAGFWDTVADASGNLAYQLCWNTLRALDGPTPASAEAYAELANAIAAGDTRGAALATAQLILRTSEAESSGGSPPAP